MSHQEFRYHVRRLHIRPGAMIPVSDPQNPTLAELEEFAKRETEKTAAIGRKKYGEGW